MKRENDDIHHEKKKDPAFDVKKTEEYKSLKEEYDALVLENKEILKELSKVKQSEKDNLELAKNFKKDMDRMKERFAEKERQIESDISSKLAKNLLLVQDNFEKSFKMVKDENILTGFKMIYANLENTIKELGVVKFKVNQGDEFDESCMNAVFAEPAGEGNKDNTVSKVFRDGYKHVLTDKILRYAEVSIYKE